MTVRGANYPRRPNDYYSTPPEVIRTLFDNVKLGPFIFDPACGHKKKPIIQVARKRDLIARGEDIATGFNFLDGTKAEFSSDLVCNPPYDYEGSRGGLLALHFIERALEVTEKHRARVAMLLPIDFDSGKTRRHVFGDHHAFALKLVLLDRIKWFNEKSGSTNHCWCVWNWNHYGPPTISYAEIE